jgi:RNA methyltransferase, TrmH family
VEGVRLVEEAVTARLLVTGVVVAPELARTTRGVALRAALEKQAVPVQDVSDRLLATLADTETPQGILAVVQPRRWSLDELPPGSTGVLLVIDGVQDPGNVGTLLRTAHALGAGATITLRGTADVWAPKTLRAAMGATFRHPIIALDDAGFIAWSARHDVTLWATAADGEPLARAIAQERERRSGVIAVIVGNEGAGIRPHLNAIAARRVAIPLTPGAESLNVGVAAGILLYEVTRVA